MIRVGFLRLYSKLRESVQEFDDFKLHPKIIENSKGYTMDLDQKTMSL